MSKKDVDVLKIEFFDGCLEIMRDDPYAYYVSYWDLHHYYYRKKQKPPLWQVTVSKIINPI